MKNEDPTDFKPFKTTFLILGIASLIGWNAVLNALDYFTAELDNDGPQFWFPIPFQFANFILGLMMPKISMHVSE
jgi:equilibrative nucleoside transporter 1/2/3